MLTYANELSQEVQNENELNLVVSWEIVGMFPKFLEIFLTELTTEMSEAEAAAPQEPVEEANPGENVDQGPAENLRDVSRKKLLNTSLLL